MDKLTSARLMELAHCGMDEMKRKIGKLPPSMLPILIGICIDKSEQLRREMKRPKRRRRHG